MDWLQVFEYLQYPQFFRTFVLAIIAGPVLAFLGAFVTLRGMAFLCDGISHGALTGVALTLMLGISEDLYGAEIQISLVVFCTFLGLMMAWLLDKTGLKPDTVISFTYTGSVALGFIVISRLGQYASLEKVLFGDILANTPQDIIVASVCCVGVVLFLLFNMRALTMCIVQEKLAQLEGMNVKRVNYLFVAMIGILVAVLLRQLGALLLSGLIVIPAAAARLVAGSFRQMMLYCVTLGLLGAVLGFSMSMQWDSPTGPTMVLANIGLFLFCFVTAKAGMHLRKRFAK